MGAHSVGVHQPAHTLRNVPLRALFMCLQAMHVAYTRCMRVCLQPEAFAAFTVIHMEVLHSRHQGMSGSGTHRLALHNPGLYIAWQLNIPSILPITTGMSGHTLVRTSTDQHIPAVS